ncbi:hypothetical protein KJ682_04285, partial [bacterium]|nr:hypothetical protein [bacterium]
DEAPLAEPEIEPVPAAVHAAETGEDAYETAEAVPAEAPLLRMEAAGGGEDRDAATRRSPEEATPQPESPLGSFLRRVGTRNIGQVEVPEPQREPAPLSQRQTAGFGSGSPRDDLSAPAYTRKYMD